MTTQEVQDWLGLPETLSQNKGREGVAHGTWYVVLPHPTNQRWRHERPKCASWERRSSSKLKPTAQEGSKEGMKSRGVVRKARAQSQSVLMLT